MKDFLTVKEFAEMANKKPQTIYKQLETRLKPYVKIDKGKKLISIEALQEYYEVEENFQPDSTQINPNSTEIQPDSTEIQPNSTENQPDSTAEIQPDSTRFNPNSTAETEKKLQPDKENEQIAALNKLIEIIQNQLAEKDKQLAVKDKQISDLSERLAEALQITRGQQYIAAADRTKELLEADTNNKEEDRQEKYTTAAADINESIEQEEIQPLPQKGLIGFLKRLFN